ncbi:MAG TPA: protease modulator HflC [Candidatus Omnitrophota bacterium]|nr:protease modulator HflC [Candidatus Omnitrophota bacterium]
MKAIMNLVGFLAFFLALLAFNSAFVVDETKQVVITQFGQPLGAPIKDAGLHFKIPFVQKANYFEKRILEWNGYPNEVPTKDKKFIWLDTTARWKITDPLLFLQSMGTGAHAQSRLDDIIDGMTRDLITSQNINDIVRNTNRIMTVTKEDEDVTGEDQIEQISVGRDQITRAILEKAKAIVSEYGIELVDVRIKRLNYIARVQQKVFERMISERKRAAEKLRSEGQGVKAEVEGQKERELKKIQSEAYRKSQQIKGQADGEAVRIYADAYSKDPEFYSFQKTLELYPITLRDSAFVMSTDADYLRYLKGKTEKPEGA